MFFRFFLIFCGLCLAHIETIFAIQTRVATAKEQDIGFFGTLFSSLRYIVENFVSIVLFIIIVWIFLKVIRLSYEVLMAGRLVYMKVTLPRADSKLDKERETKKDFKEKVGIMSVFYKSIHNLTQASAFDTVMNFIFRHAKISLELMYHHGMVHFYVV
jgi:hypothetical protein